MKKQDLTMPLAVAVGAVLIGTPAAEAASPFSITTLATPYMMTADDTAAGGKEAEGKCGADKAGEGKCGEDKAKEGKCGEGKCGEGKCGSDKEGAGEKEPENKEPAG